MLLRRRQRVQQRQELLFVLATWAKGEEEREGTGSVLPRRVQEEAGRELVADADNVPTPHLDQHVLQNNICDSPTLAPNSNPPQKGAPARGPSVSHHLARNKANHVANCMSEGAASLGY